jgi:hypothetical protein
MNRKEKIILMLNEYKKTKETTVTSLSRKGERKPSKRRSKLCFRIITLIEVIFQAIAIFLSQNTKIF